MSSPELITCYLNSLLAENACFKSAKFYPIVESATRDGKTWPVYNKSGVGEDVIFEDGVNKFYWKLIGEPSFVEDAEAYGESRLIINLSLKLHFIGTLRGFANKCASTQLEALMLVLGIIPLNAFTAHESLRNGVLTQAGSESDKQAFISGEYPGFELDPKILDLVAFSITYNFSGLYCSTC